jgi:hypothetical protein
VVLAAPLAAEAQQAWIPRIGILGIGSPTDPAPELFRQALRELGYAEGRNVVPEYWWAEGRLDRLPRFAADLGALKINVIVAASVAGVRAAKKATAIIPIVMQATTDRPKRARTGSVLRRGWRRWSREEGLVMARRLTGRRGAKGAQGQRGGVGLTGPAGPPGPPGIEGMRGATGARGATGRSGVTTKASRKPTIRMIEHLNREMSTVHKALETQLIRIAQIQQQLDELRARVSAEGR